MLEIERKYFEQCQKDLMAKYPAKYVVIKGEELIGAYDTIEDALQDGAKRFGLDAFLLRRSDETSSEISVPAYALGILNANPSLPIACSGRNT